MLMKEKISGTMNKLKRKILQYDYRSDVITFDFLKKV